ncbi:MAG: beta-Ala-His dipeptidase [Victivallales bacterium]|nr:beta-Ala-His dipeptidase [Victivallales bacterium]MCF7889177.1 beta-Ala-His dipeptidase [Victivallales bacterium]
MNCIRGIESLKPKEFWKNFNSILSIPHPSGHEQKLIQFLKDFSENSGLGYSVDETGNMVIRKPAAKGKERSPGIILQAHLDMVPQKNPNTEHDFIKDPIYSYVEDGWIKTCGTTLGADDGTGVAAIMTVLEDKSIQHGPIEALLTVQEEVGLQGAGKLKSGILNGKYLINLDSGPEDCFVIGCAGGADSEVTFGYKTEELKDAESYESVKLTVKGLKGGHSGSAIHCQLGNANKILFRLLYRINKNFHLKIIDINSGGLRNAIPREGSAVFAVRKNDRKKIINTLNNEFEDIKQELNYADPRVCIEIEEMPLQPLSIDKKTQNNLVSSLHVCHNGVIRYFDNVKEAVQASVNLANVKMDPVSKQIKILFMTRSAVESLKQENCDKIDALFTTAGAKQVRHYGQYPGWLPKFESDLQTVAEKTFKRILIADFTISPYISNPYIFLKLKT